MLLDDEYIWIKENHSFSDIFKRSTTIKWTEKPYIDFKSLSVAYFECARKICEEILENPDDNSKCDTWFFPAVYMFRQSLELLLKALICKEINRKREMEDVFESCKHNLWLLFGTYKSASHNMLINNEEAAWLEDYLKSIEIVDEKSDLFRYPFTEDFFQTYKNKFFDIADMGNAFLMVYTILGKCDTGIENKDIIEIDTKMPTEFIRYAGDGYGNCYIWKSIKKNDFYAQVTGYNRVAEFLFKQLQEVNTATESYPIIFLLRNAIELGLKRLLYSNTQIRVATHKIYSVRNSHLLYKDLWKNISGMLEHYAAERDEDLNTLKLFDKYVKELSLIDKKGDIFRYPCSYSMEYKFNNEQIDIDNVYRWMQGMFQLLDGCDAMLDSIADYESEMNSYW